MADEPVRLIWSLTASGLGTTLSTAGNSGTWANPGPPPWTPNALTPVDLRWVDDLWLSVSAAGGAGTSLKAQLNLYDDQGNLFQFITGTTPLLGTTAITSAPGSAIAFGGRHGGGGSGNYFVPSSWGQVAWATTGTFTGVEIALYGRG
jgi:hypothetical protein